jgi:hypothetical protein
MGNPTVGFLFSQPNPSLAWVGLSFPQPNPWVRLLRNNPTQPNGKPNNIDITDSRIFIKRIIFRLVYIFIIYYRIVILSILY